MSLKIHPPLKRVFWILRGKKNQPVFCATLIPPLSTPCGRNFCFFLIPVTVATCQQESSRLLWRSVFWPAGPARTGFVSVGIVPPSPRRAGSGETSAFFGENNDPYPGPPTLSCHNHFRPSPPFDVAAHKPGCPGKSRPENRFLPLPVATGFFFRRWITPMPPVLTNVSRQTAPRPPSAPGMGHQNIPSHQVFSGNRNCGHAMLFQINIILLALKNPPTETFFKFRRLKEPRTPVSEGCAPPGLTEGDFPAPFTFPIFRQGRPWATLMLM